MKIGFVTQWYEPETGSAAHPAAIARSLRERRHDLRVLTAFPSYPDGRVHSGYRMRLRLDETRHQVALRRVADVPSHDQSAARRALSLTSFALSATANVRWLREADVVLTYLTPATVGLAPWLLRKTAGVPYVLYVQDLWPETITASGFIGNPTVERVVERALSRPLRRLYEGAARVVAISPSMASALSSRGSLTPPVSIPNWIDEHVFKPPAEGASSGEDWDGRKWIMYAGGMGELQALDHAVRAISLLPDRPDIGLVFVGEGVARAGLEQLTRRLGIGDRVRFLGSRAMHDMPVLLTESLAQLVTLRDLPVFRGTIPSKIQASMACGAPVICAVAGDAADLVSRTGAGIVVVPESAESLASAFRQMADLSPDRRRQMGQRGLDAYRHELSAKAGSERLEQVLVEAAKGSSR